MWKRKWLWCAMAALPLLAAGAWAGVQALDDTPEPATAAAVAPANPCCDSVCPLCAPVSQAAEGDCCADPTCPPGCSPDCPPNCLDLAANTVAGARANPSVKTICPPCPFCP